MGCAHSKRRSLYAVPINTDEEPKGETHIYRPLNAKDGLISEFRDDPNVKTVKDIYLRSFEKFADRPFLGTRERKGIDSYGEYKFKTYKEVHEIGKQIGSAIENLNLAPHTHDDHMTNRFVGVWAKNCEEWIELDVACSLYKFTTVPIYTTLGPDIVKFVVSQTKMATIFCTADHVDDLIKGMEKQELTTLKNVVIFGKNKITKSQHSEAEKYHLNLYPWEDLLESGKDKMQEPAEVKPEDVYTLCYTSGTTGTPKGTILTHRNQTSSIAATNEREDLKIDENDVYYSYLPLAHCMERSGILFMINKGTKVCFSTGEKRTMMEDLQAAKPTIFFGVPKVYMTIYNGIQKKISEQGAMAPMIKMAIKAKLLNLKLRSTYTHPIYDRLIFNKFRAAMGGNLRYCATGAAPLDADILNFLRVVWCIPIVEGYGPTEGCAITFLSRPNDPTNGQVGGPMGCLEYKLIDEEEMKYTSKDKEGPRGEICFRGPCAFGSYFKNPDKTKEGLDKDGWVRTGDIGMINPNGSLSVIDKKKSMFKLAQGEYVAGDKVEEAYKKNDLVKEMFIYGDSSKSYLVTVVIPDKDKIEAIGKELGLEGSFDDLLKNNDLKRRVLEELNKTAANGKLNGYEVAKNIHLDSKTFEENDLMTPTQKLKRGEAKEKYQTAIDQMYESGPLVSDDRQQ